MTHCKLSRIQRGPPYQVDLVGPWQFPQVADAHGNVAVIGRNGAPFCRSITRARRLCALANAGRIK